MRLGILADDFTGAGDAAGPFAAQGFRTTVLLRLAPQGIPFDGEEVVVIDLNAREQAADETYRRARAAAAAFAGPARLLAKIDSTLRGEILAFIDGVLDGAGLGGAVIAPAFPEQGRLLVGGRLTLADGADGADLMERLNWDAALVPLDRGPWDGPLLARELERRFAAGARHVVVDAAAPQRLRQVAEAWWRAAAPLLLVGSAGVARQVAEMAAEGATGSGQETVGDGRPTGGVLVIVGSPAAATRQQLRAFEGHPAARIVTVDPGGPPASVAAGAGEVLVLASEDPDRVARRDSGGWAAALADACASRAGDWRPAGVAIAGGTTARAVCERLGVRAVRIRGELAPGVPYGTLVGGVWDGVVVITKAGAFGGRDQLVEAARWIGALREVAT